MINQLKEKEKMLGIPLITILEVKEKGIFYKDEKGNIEQIGKMRKRKEGNRIGFLKQK